MATQFSNWVRNLRQSAWRVPNLQSAILKTKLYHPVRRERVMQINRAIIEAAIVGFEKQKQQIDETIAELRSQLDGNSVTRGRKTSVPSAPSKTSRKMSASARKRIADAQKARWAAFHAKQGAPSKKATPAIRSCVVSSARCSDNGQNSSSSAETSNIRNAGSPQIR